MEARHKDAAVAEQMTADFYRSEAFHRWPGGTLRSPSESSPGGTEVTTRWFFLPPADGPGNSQ